jgi:hypothetical protein
MVEKVLVAMEWNVSFQYYMWRLWNREVKTRVQQCGSRTYRSVYHGNECCLSVTALMVITMQDGTICSSSCL